MSIFDIRNTMRELADKGAHNINLVTPTHYTPVLSTVLEDKPDIPIVWNSGGYELSTTLESLRGKVDVFLPDMKYSDSGLGQKYSGIPDYFPVAQTAIRAMYAITGDYVIENGLLKRGVLIRHLMLPNELENTLGVIKWVSKFKRGQVLFSLMSQYTPNGANGIPMGQITQAEYDTAIEYMHKCGITNGYAQELSSARQGYVPNWFLKGQL
jgi:putative pyruvate formate lyase activating enzyme